MLNILLLEDTTDSAKDTIGILEKIGYENIEHIRDSRKLMEMSKDKIYEFDVGILDWMMNELAVDDAPSGFQVGQHLKKANGDLSLIVLTGQPERKDLRYTRKALKKGAPFDDYLIKTPTHILEEQLEQFLKNEERKRYPKRSIEEVEIRLYSRNVCAKDAEYGSRLLSAGGQAFVYLLALAFASEENEKLSHRKDDPFLARANLEFCQSHPNPPSWTIPSPGALGDVHPFDTTELTSIRGRINDKFRELFGIKLLKRKQQGKPFGMSKVNARKIPYKTEP
jgi:CheY-like chemotaxis protein